MIEVLILSSPGCSHCSQARKVIDKVKKDFPKLKVVEKDITKHPELVQKYQIMSTPGIVINGKLEFTGGMKEDAFRKKLKSK